MSTVKEMANHALTTFESLNLERKKGAWILEPHDHDSMRKLAVEATKAKDKNLFYVTSCLCCFCVSESFPRSGEHIYSTTRCSAHSLPPCQINLAVSSGTSRDRWQLEESMAVLIFFVKHVGRSERLETDCCSACANPRFINGDLDGEKLSCKSLVSEAHPQAEQNRKLKASTKKR